MSAEEDGVYWDCYNGDTVMLHAGKWYVKDETCYWPEFDDNDEPIGERNGPVDRPKAVMGPLPVYTKEEEDNREKIAELRAALKPFAHPVFSEKWSNASIVYARSGVELTTGDFERAAAALKEDEA